MEICVLIRCDMVCVQGGFERCSVAEDTGLCMWSRADCNPIHQTAPCFNPNTVRAHCSYAVNSYFQKYRQAPIACDFSGTASVVTSDPSQSSQP
ncbi:UNVERIFIED_CONTAM: plasmodesmata callose-binding protein 2 [Sesamum latifolium]|uniref:Plasmodesmata callose-binding protein 2 n=1 Tax=Sesamum latifolium TaxID=2727402 RepID=A0AAW2UHC9_9LAMI